MACHGLYPIFHAPEYLLCSMDLPVVARSGTKIGHGGLWKVRLCLVVACSTHAVEQHSPKVARLWLTNANFHSMLLKGLHHLGCLLQAPI